MTESTINGRTSSALKMLLQLVAATERQIVHQRLCDIGLYARRVVICLPPTFSNVKLFLRFFRQCYSKRDGHWADILFTIASSL